MKRIGIIGGLGPESTIDYYKGIINAFRQREVGLLTPEIIIYSADVSRLLDLVEAKEWNNLVDWLVNRVKALHSAGAEFAVIGSNTPHIVFDNVKSRSPIPMLSIVDETCKRASSMKLKKLGLMGTKFTMESDFYQKSFHDVGISVIVPMKDERQLIHHKIISEIGLGIIRNSTRQELLSIAKRMIDDDSIDGMILGCTELPMILEKDEYGIPFLKTTAIHIDSIVDYCIGKTDLNKERHFWDKEYENCLRIWGDKPSELAIIAVKYLKSHRLGNKYLSILDIGCGYGRDCLYLAKNLNCNVFGIDTSQNAIEILKNSTVDPYTKAIQFRCCDFIDMDQCKYDIVFASNLYQILQKKQREEFRKKINNLLKPEGLLFLNNLSTGDPEEYGKGEPCPNENNSFKNNKYLHFCTREELEEDFKFLSIKELYEHEYDEPRAQGETHHHISWILIAEKVV